MGTVTGDFIWQPYKLNARRAVSFPLSTNLNPSPSGAINETYQMEVSVILY